MTRGQTRALTEQAQALIPEHEPGPVDWTARFGRQAPLGLEIGFGMGQALLDWAESAPELNLLGVDVYRPGIGALLLGKAARQLDHLLVIEADARLALATLLAPDSLSEVRIFFPDPWPKKRHHKRRLIQAPFVALLASRLKVGGRLRLATDWGPYAEQMLAVLEAEPLFASESDGGFAPRFAGRPVTRFEQRGQRLGHAVWDLAYRRCTSPTGGGAPRSGDAPATREGSDPGLAGPQR
jgi:tRNA (guanine-N7-)-methyltransferase